MSALIEARAIACARGGRTLLDTVTVSAGAGEFIGVVGPNGAGKSTLLRLLAGLEQPSSGAVLSEDEPLSGLSRRERARRLGYHPQTPELHWALPVATVVALGRLPHAGSLARLTTADEAAIGRAIERTSLRALLARRGDELSGGELARVHLARLLAGEHRVLLADEPIANLDPHFQFGILEILRAHARAGGATIAVLHDLAIAARYCDRVLLIDAGRLCADGPPAAVLTRAAVAETFRVTPDYFELSGLAAALGADGRGLQ